MSEVTSEVKWSCGCHIVNGTLVQECTQTAPSGELSASQLAAQRPFSPSCSRKRASIHAVEPEGPKPFGEPVVEE